MTINEMMGYSNMITVIIPSAGKRIDKLRNCLRGLSMQRFRKFNVVVCVKNPSEEVQELVKGWSKMLDCELLERPCEGNGPARNFAAAYVADKYRSEWLAFTDDDCVPDSNWLSAFANKLVNSFFDNPNTVPKILGGDVPAPAASSVWLDAHQAHIQYCFETLNQPDKLTAGTTMNLLVNAKMFSLLGGFRDEFARSYGCDRDFNYRWLKAGVFTAYVDQAKVVHDHTMSLKRFTQLEFKYGIGASFISYLYNDWNEKWNMPFSDVPGMFKFTRKRYGPKAAFATVLLWLIKTVGFEYGIVFPKFNYENRFLA